MPLSTWMRMVTVSMQGPDWNLEECHNFREYDDECEYYDLRKQYKQRQ